MVSDSKKTAPGSRNRLLDGWVGFAMRSSRTIRLRLLGLVTVSVVIPSLMTGFLANYVLSSDLRRQVLSNAAFNTSVLAERVSHWLRQQSNQVRAFTSSSYLFTEEIGKLMTGGEPDGVGKAAGNVSRYLSYLLEDNPQFRGLAVLTGSGQILAAQPQGFAPPLTTQLLAQAEIAPDIIETLTPDGDAILLIQRVAGRFSGRRVYLAASLKPESLFEVLAHETSGETTAYLVDQEGRTRGGSSTAEGIGKFPDAASSLLQKDAVPVIYRGAGNEPVIASSHKLDLLEWTIVAEEPRAKAFESVARFRLLLVFLTAMAILILLIPALRMGQAILSPLEELSRVASRIRSGEAGLTVQARPGGELGEFISAFNSMSLSLHGSMEELSALHSQLRIMSITDPLTGRYNRRFMEDYLERAVKLAARAEDSFSIIMLDIDRFKVFNDTYGHIAGDEALKQLGDLMAQNLRETDVVSRFGGEEFLICLNQADGECAKQLAEKLRATVEAAVFRLRDKEAHMTVSLGVSTFPGDGESFEVLLDKADMALYNAKETGRNKVCTASEPCLPSATREDQTEASPGSSRRSSRGRQPHHRGTGSRPSPPKGQEKP